MRRTFGHRMRSLFRGGRPGTRAGNPASPVEAEKPKGFEVAEARRETGKREEESVRLLLISKSAVQMAALGPKLAKLGADLEVLAGDQAKQAAMIATTAAALAGDLDKAVSELRLSSTHVDESLATVARISENTKIISINASIEAARAGAHGKAFGVVVEEVQRLSVQSGEITKTIEERMGDMRSSIVRVAQVAEHSGESEKETAAVSVNRVNEGVQSMAVSANQQLAEAKSLHEMSDSMNALADQMLLSVGAFRFEIHRRASEALGELVELLAAAGSRKQDFEHVMEEWIQIHRAFELVYATDVTGKQIVDNLALAGTRVARDVSGLGKDWSQRPWYLTARGTTVVHCTDLYRSSATGDYCFTVSAAYKDESGLERGVVAADVNFRKLVEGV